MKCPNCSAETDKRVCPYCGSEVPIPNAGKTKCPKCGSRNTTFRRESYGSRSRSTSVKITKRVRTRSGGSSRSYRTIGMCQDCGYTWAPNSGGAGSKPWWMWVLIVMFWPISLSIWFWKTSMFNLPNKTKGIILGAVWGVFFLFSAIVGATGESSDTKVAEETPPVESVAVNTQVSETTEPASNVVERSVPTEQEAVPELVEEQKEEPEASVTVAYATDVVNIREQPNTDCEILGKTKPGDEVTVLGTEGDWSHVMTNGTDGYIKSEYLSDKPAETASKPEEKASE